MLVLSVHAANLNLLVILLDAKRMHHTASKDFHLVIWSMAFYNLDCPTIWKKKLQFFLHPGVTFACSLSTWCKFKIDPSVKLIEIFLPSASLVVINTPSILFSYASFCLTSHPFRIQNILTSFWGKSAIHILVRNQCHMRVSLKVMLLFECHQYYS